MLKRRIIMVLVWLIVLAIACGFSWLFTCGLVGLICMCFGWTFSWAVATGVWLITILIGAAVKK
jgi:hypothetical protein